MLNEIFQGERAGFIAGKGFCIGDKIIADFSPTVVAKYAFEDLDEEGKISYQYDVVVEKADGSKLEPVRVSNFEDINWYAHFGICDAELSTKDKKYLAFKLQAEAKECKETITEIVASPGFYIRKGVPIMVIGNKVFMPKETRDINVRSKSTLMLKEGEFPDIMFMAEQFIRFMPGVSESLFYGSLLGAVKSILYSMSVITDFQISLVAPSGHLKTTMVRKYGLILQNPSDQEVTFTDSIRSDVLQRKIEAMSGLSFLLDDYHAAQKHYDREKFRSRLDQCTRISSGVRNSAFIFMTAESLDGSGIFSALDRMVQVHIPKMDAEKLATFKAGVSGLQDDNMAIIITAFVQAVLDNFEAVQNEVMKFMKETKVPEWCEGNTRVGNQIRVLLLVEHLYCMLLCGGDKERSHHEEFKSALEKQGKKQVKRLTMLRRDEEEVDYIQLLNEIASEGTRCIDIVIFNTRAQYSEDSGDQALIFDGCFWLTSQALQKCLMSRLGKPVSLKKVSNDLHDYGILIEDTDSRQRKYQGKRHYCLDIRAMERYCNTLSDRMC